MMINYVVYTTETGSSSVDLYYVGNNRPKAEAVYIEELNNFLNSSPNNKTSFRLIEVDLFDDEIKLLKDEFKTGQFTLRVAKLLESLLLDSSCTVIYCETGYEDLIIFYCDQNDLYFYDYKDYETVNKIFTHNPGLLKQVVKDYIKANY